MEIPVNLPVITSPPFWRWNFSDNSRPQISIPSKWTTIFMVFLLGHPSSHIPSLKLTYHLKMDASSLLGWPNFRGYVSLPEGILFCSQQPFHVWRHPYRTPAIRQLPREASVKNCITIRWSDWHYRKKRPSKFDNSYRLRGTYPETSTKT